MSTSTGLEIKKCVFVVHSRGDGLHALLYDRLKAIAEPLQLALYEYGDWPWDREVAPRYENYGSADQLDPVLLHVHDPFPFRHQARKPDENALWELWRDASVVLVLEAEGRLSEGMRFEMNSLESFSGPNPAILVSVALPDADARYLEGLPVAFRFNAPDVDDKEKLTNQILALVVVSRLGHLLRSFGPAGFFVLAEAAVGNPIVRQIVERSRGQRKLDFEALESESRARGVRMLTQDTSTDTDAAIAEEILDRMVAVNNETDRVAMWESTVSRAVSWLRSHRSEHELMDAGCVVADWFENGWIAAYERFRYALLWPG